MALGVIVAVIGACGGDDEAREGVDATFDAIATVGSTYEIALSDSNAWRTCVAESVDDAAALQACADDSSDAISGPATVAELVANRAEPLREVAGDERASACVAQVEALHSELDAWSAAATAWRTAFDADPSDTALTGGLIDAVGDRQSAAESAWAAMRSTCRNDPDG